MNRYAVRGARLPAARWWAPRPGFTLVELLVVIAIIGLMAAISGVAVASLKMPRESEQAAALRRARARAIETGIPTWADSNRPPRTADVLFLPDGRALGPGVDPLTGQFRAP